MANATESTTSLPELGEGILKDVERLIGQHIDLLRGELREQLDRIEGGGVALGIGGGALLTSGLLSGMMLAHLLHQATRLPLWVCYGLTAGGSAAIGAGLFTCGARQIAQVASSPR